MEALEGEEELVIKALDDQTVVDRFSQWRIHSGRRSRGADLESGGHRRALYQFPAGDTVGLDLSGMLLSHADRARIAQNAGGQP